jgi:hypothetical protein
MGRPSPTGRTGRESLDRRDPQLFETSPPQGGGIRVTNRVIGGRPIGLFNVCMQLVHHVVNYRLTVITEAENLIAPGQDGGRAGRGVDLHQLKPDGRKKGVVAGVG